MSHARGYFVGLEDREVLLGLCSRGNYSGRGLRYKVSIWDVNWYLKLHGGRSPRMFGSIINWC